jgi:predicted alternative tryptophan synthase beta-subunit
MKLMQKLEIIDEIINAGLIYNDLTKDKFHKVKNEIYKKYKLPKPIPTIEIIERYNNLTEA